MSSFTAAPSANISSTWKKSCSDSGPQAESIKILFCQESGFQYQILGYFVSKDGIQPGPQNVKNIQDWLTPHSATEVSPFIGLCSYYWKFIRNFAHHCVPLHASHLADICCTAPISPHPILYIHLALPVLYITTAPAEQIQKSCSLRQPDLSTAFSPRSNMGYTVYILPNGASVKTESYTSAVSSSEKCGCH